MMASLETHPVSLHGPIINNTSRVLVICVPCAPLYVTSIYDSYLFAYDFSVC